MKSSDLNIGTSTDNEQTNEIYDDLKFLLSGSGNIPDTGRKPEPETGEFTLAIRQLNDILKSITILETQNLLGDWITPQEVMQKLYISERTLAEWRKINKIGFSPVGNKFYYKKQDIENLLQGRYVKAKVCQGKR